MLRVEFKAPRPLLVVLAVIALGMLAFAILIGPLPVDRPAEWRQRVYGRRDDGSFASEPSAPYVTEDGEIRWTGSEPQQPSVERQPAP